MVTAELLRQEPDYGWNESLTEHMEGTTIHQYLLKASQELEGQDEWECAYGIFREMVWRFPNDAVAWQGLARTARAMRYDEEADVASLEAQRLASG